MTHEPSNHEPDIDPQGLWQSQKKEYDAMTLADIHLKARRFESKVQRRNAVEYFACGIVIVGFAPALLFGPHWMMKAGAGLIMLAVPFVAWQLHRRGSVEASPEPGESLVESYRRQLVRQHAALRTVGSWYLAPFAPGLVAMMAGVWLAPLKPGVSIERKHASLLIATALVVVAFAAVWLWNQHGARRLQKRIDEL
ncbi:MAG: hypothetical protein ACXU82_21905 [Caulobacteraceae bacterium]